jgi:hypothetical protein
VRENRWKTPSQHCLSCAWRSDQEQVVAASRRNLKSSTSQGLVTDIRKIKGLTPALRWFADVVGDPSILGNGDGMAQGRDSGEHHAV